MNLIHILSSSSGAGKTVWSVGFIRALVDLGIRVAPFKALSDDVEGYNVPNGKISISALHLIASARLKRDGIYNPVLMIPKENNLASVWLKGNYLGDVPSLGRDTYFLEELGKNKLQLIEKTALECLEKLNNEFDIIVSEGSGSAVDLFILNSYDLANNKIASLAKMIILVARASKGGCISNLSGALEYLPSNVKKNLNGIAINDVRYKFDELINKGKELAIKNKIEFIGAIPRLTFFDNRESFPPFSDESELDYNELASAIKKHTTFEKLLVNLNLKY
ncbi:MAG: hypothetical protein HXX09_10995 [Bacteroidetes bacterium]|nr:hypothetical protein [Bacteroidota bacterium]